MSIRSIGAYRVPSNTFNLNKWLADQGAAAQQDLSLNNAANSSFTTAQSNYYQNSATQTAQAVLDREQSQAQTQTAALQTLVNNAESAESASSTGGSVNVLA
jgi:hypothetical protein